MMNSASRNVRSRRSVLMLAALFSLMLFGCKDAVGGSKGAVGAKPEFRLKTLDGRKLGPKDFPGQVVVVDFWATWCGPCRQVAPVLDQIAAEHPDYAVVKVDIDQAPNTGLAHNIMGLDSPGGLPVQALLSAQATEGTRGQIEEDDEDEDENQQQGPIDKINEEN